MLLVVFVVLLSLTIFLYYVYGVDAVKGPRAVFIFSAWCVLLVIVIVNRLGVGGWGGVDVHCECKVLLHVHTYVMLRYC